MSIRIPGGLQNKSAKGWTQLVEHMNENGSAKVKDRFILSIEDPFETTHNVARTVTRAGLYDIRGGIWALLSKANGDLLNRVHGSCSSHSIEQAERAHSAECVRHYSKTAHSLS